MRLRIDLLANEIEWNSEMGGPTTQSQVVPVWELRQQMVVAATATYGASVTGWGLQWGCPEQFVELVV